MNNEKLEQAKNIFFQTDLSKTEIAEMLGIPRRTLHYWIRQHNWTRQKEAAAIMPSLLAEDCYHLIARFTKQLLSADQITHKDAEALHKFTITTNKLKNRATLNENMEIFGNFMDSVNEKSPEVANVITPFVDDYIAARSEITNSKSKPVSSAASPQANVPESFTSKNDPPVTTGDSVEAHVREFKRMFPDSSDEDLQEFRVFCHENFGADSPAAATIAA
jgi:transposase-like protein